MDRVGPVRAAALAAAACAAYARAAARRPELARSPAGLIALAASNVLLLGKVIHDALGKYVKPTTPGLRRMEEAGRSPKAGEALPEADLAIALHDARTLASTSLGALLAEAAGKCGVLVLNFGSCS